MAPRPMFCMSGILIFSQGGAPASKPSSDRMPRRSSPGESQLRGHNVTCEFSNEPNAGPDDDMKISGGGQTDCDRAIEDEIRAALCSDEVGRVIRVVRQPHEIEAHPTPMVVITTGMEWDVV